MIKLFKGLFTKRSGELPNGWDCRLNVKVSFNEVKKWQKEVVETLLKDEKQTTHTYIASGNSICIGIKHDGVIDTYMVNNGYIKHWYEFKG